MWFLIQSSIIFAVMASNIRYKWTPNPYVAGLVAAGAAFAATALLNELLTWARRYQTSARPRKGQ
jgi:hypothetical protein